MFFNCFILRYNLSINTDIYAYAGSVVIATNIVDETAASSSINSLVSELNSTSGCLDDSFCPKSISILGVSYDLKTSETVTINPSVVALVENQKLESQNAVRFKLKKFII